MRISLSNTCAFQTPTTRRDYTYVGDIVEGVQAAIGYENSMYEVFNLGNARTVTLADMARSLAEVLELKAEYAILPERPGDLPQTYADIGEARSLLGYEPRTDFSSGLREFAAWLTGTRKLRRRAMQA